MANDAANGCSAQRAQRASAGEDGSANGTDARTYSGVLLAL